VIGSFEASTVHSMITYLQ